MIAIYDDCYFTMYHIHKNGKKNAKRTFTRSNRPLLYRPVTYIVRLAIWCYYHGSYKYLRCSYSLKYHFLDHFIMLSISDWEKNCKYVVN